MTTDESNDQVKQKPRISLGFCCACSKKLNEKPRERPRADREYALSEEMPVSKFESALASVHFVTLAAALLWLAIEPRDPAIPLPKHQIVPVNQLLRGLDGRAVVHATEVEGLDDAATEPFGFRLRPRFRLKASEGVDGCYRKDARA